MDATPSFRPPEAPALSALPALVEQDMQRVNATILERTCSDVTMIPEVAQHLISSGGKRLRPMLTLAMGHLCQGVAPGHVLLAAAVEFMHTATLLHDDVVDESRMRRGKPSARMVWGNEASVLVGDFLLGQAFRMMVDAGSLDCLRVLSHAAAVIAEGEVLQLAHVACPSMSRDVYFQVIGAKTAVLFAAACEVGPLLSGAAAEQVQAARTYGHELGMAFQLIDDALDYSGDAGLMGKQSGDDFREGKITLPLIIALEQSTGRDQAFWTEMFADRTARDDQAFTRALKMVQGARGVDLTRALAATHASRACQALRAFPASAMRHALEEAAGFVVSRAS